jgi:hypothetical protein
MLFMVIILAAAAPWYARNLVLYGSLSAIQQAAGGQVGPGEVLQAALSLPWHTSVLPLMRGSLWTGNNSFTSFSRATLDVMLALLLGGVFLWGWSVRKSASRALEALLAASCLCFLAAVLYNYAMFYALTKGTQMTATPWYTHAVAAPLVCLVCLGFSRSGGIGRWAGVALGALSTYIIAATYLVKLIPMYAGCASGKTQLPDLYNCYFRDAGARQQMLAETALGSPVLIITLACAVVATALALLALLYRRMRDKCSRIPCKR